MRTVLKGLGYVLLALVAVVGLVVGWSTVRYRMELRHRYVFPSVHLSRPAKTGNLAHGKRLVTIRLECVECHGKDLAGGTVVEDPVAGHVYGANITPAKLKDWTDDEIATVLKHGVARDGHPLVIMPSEDYQNMSEADLIDVIAYLRSVPAVVKADRPSHAGPLLRFFWATGKAPFLLPVGEIDHAKGFAPAVPEAPTEAFGRYMVTNLCIGCHQPSLKGGPMPGAPPDWVPAANITQDSLGTWSEADFIKTLKTGVNPSGSALRMPMKMNIKYTAQWTDVEYKAAWAYLKTVKGAPDKSGF